jgi:hypothetical protein
MSRAGQIKSRSPAFGLFVLLLTVFCAALTAGGLIRVYRLAVAFEHSAPARVVEGVVRLFREEDYAVLALEGGLALSPFEDAGHLGAVVRDRMGGDPQSVEAVRLSQGRYRIQSGSTPLAELSLSYSPAAGEYGLDVWELESLALQAFPRDDLIILAPAQTAVSLNGKILTEDFAEDTAVAAGEYGALPQGVAPALLTRYRVSGLLARPQITAGSPDGAACAVNLVQNTATVTCPAGEETIAQLSPLAERAAMAYANFITKDAELDDVLPFFLKGTQCYTNLRQFDNRWYNEHDAFAFSDMQTGCWQALDGDHVRCDVVFEYSITMGRRVFDYPSRYTLYFVRTGPDWKISNLLVGQPGATHEEDLR